MLTALLTAPGRYAVTLLSNVSGTWMSHLNGPLFIWGTSSVMFLDSRCGSYVMKNLDLSTWDLCDEEFQLIHNQQR